MNRRISSRGILLATVHLLVAAAAVTVQAAELTPGVRVRVTIATFRPEREVGVVVQADTDSLIFTAEEPALATPRRLAWDSIANLEVWAGRRSQVGKGAGLGLAIGA